jgi:hypothetical protein
MLQSEAKKENKEEKKLNTSYNINSILNYLDHQIFLLFFFILLITCTQRQNAKGNATRVIQVAVKVKWKHC